MDPNPLILQLITVTVATAFAPFLAVKLYKRKIKVEIFQYRCDLVASYSIDNFSTTSTHAELMRIMYQRHRRGFLAMLFSRKPLEIEYWYDPTFRKIFFENEIPKKQGSSPYGRTF